MKRLTSALSIVLLVAGAGITQEGGGELTPYSVTEVENFLNSFKSTYNKKNVPEEDAISVLADLRKAYDYLASKGEGASKEELDAKEDIVSMITRGLKARNRPRLTAECVRALDRIRDDSSARDLVKWLDKVLDDNGPNPQFVEYGFLAVAHIGPQDSRTVDLMLKYATGKHIDSAVTSHALRAVYEYRFLKGKDRKEFFKKIDGYLLGLYSVSKGNDAKKKAAAEQRFNAVKDNGMRALSELAGPGQKFALPTESHAWFDENKSGKWEDYVGVEFRPKEVAVEKPEEKKDAEG